MDKYVLVIGNRYFCVNQEMAKQINFTVVNEREKQMIREIGDIFKNDYPGGCLEIARQTVEKWDRLMDDYLDEDWKIEIGVKPNKENNNFIFIVDGENFNSINAKFVEAIEKEKEKNIIHNFAWAFNFTSENEEYEIAQAVYENWEKIKKIIECKDWELNIKIIPNEE